MSVSLTEDQVRARAKDVTRRAGWLMLEPGDRLTLCRKVMGRRKGEPLVRIVDVEVIAARRERLDAITEEDVRREGFPDWSPAEFVAFFCQTHKGTTPGSEVTRIVWRYVCEHGEPEAPTGECWANIGGMPPHLFGGCRTMAGEGPCTCDHVDWDVAAVAAVDKVQQTVDSSVADRVDEGGRYG
jgi:hypothetical protein